MRDYALPILDTSDASISPETIVIVAQIEESDSSEAELFFRDWGQDF